MDTNAIKTILTPIGDAPLPECTLDGVPGCDPIPVVSFGAWPSQVEIHLGNVDDPGKYLHDLGVRLLVLADQVEAAQPVPFVPAGGVAEYEGDVR